MTDISATAFFSQAGGEGDASGASATDFFREAGNAFGIPEDHDPGPSPLALRQQQRRQENEDYWQANHSRIKKIHRGMTVTLPQDIHDEVHNPDLSPDHRAQVLLKHVATRPFGMHWSSDQKLSTAFAKRGRRDSTDTAVVIHAATPAREHIETDPQTLSNEAVFPHDHPAGESEVPLKDGAPVNITGVSWLDGSNRKTTGKVQGHHTASLTGFFREATTHPGPGPEGYAKQDGEDYSDHDARVRYGLSMGHLTHEQARAHKYTFSGHEDNGWKPLPQALYHTTTDAAGVMTHGLKAAHELGQGNGHGLGGTPKYLSMTDSADHAHNMLNALHEYHDVLNGKTSLHDLKAASERGEGAEKPFHDSFMGTFGSDPHHAEATLNEKVIEPGMRTYKEAAEQGLTPHPTIHQDWGEAKDGRAMGSGWIRDMTDKEKLYKRHEAYGNFSRSREWTGNGKPSVLFISNNREAFAKKDPSNFAVVKARPKPGAQGHYLPGEHEWRTGTGDAVQVHGEPLRRTSARIGQVVRPFERTASAQTWYTVRHYDAENIARHRNPNRRTYADLNEAQGHADQITQREGLPGVTMVNTTHPDQSGYVHSHPHAGGGSIIGLGRNALDEGVLIHEMTHHLLHHKGISTDDHHAPAFGEHLGRMLDDHHSDPGAGPAFRDALQQTDHQMRTNPGGTSHSFKAPYPQMPAAEQMPSSNDRSTTPLRPAGPAVPPGPQADDRPRGTIQLRPTSAATAPSDGTIYCRTHPTDLQTFAAVPKAVHDYTNGSWQTIRHYNAESLLRDTHPPRKYGSLGEAQSHADEIADAHGVPRVKVTHGETDGWSHYKPSAYHSDGVYGPVIGLAKDALDDHTLVHEMAHHVADHAGGRTILNDHHDRGFVGHHLELASQHLPHGTAHALAQHIADTDVDMRRDPQKWAEHRGHPMPEIPEEEQYDGRTQEHEYAPPTAMDRVRRLFRRSSADTPVPDNTKPYEHEHDWLPPREHFFAPTADDLDPRLFEGDRIRPEVRYALLGALNDFWAPKYGDSWQSWARVYLAGSEASKFTGRNNDLDVLIGIDYDAARHHVDALTGETDRAIDTKLTDELREGLNSDHRMLPGPGGKETGPYESTWYVNPDSWDLKKLKPYAAYDLTNDQWEVRPVTTPADFGPEKLPESTWDVMDAVIKLVKAVGELPEGTREREGAALWDYLHGDRHAAFGPDGTGLYDPANIVWKSLDSAPGSPLKQLVEWKHAHDGAAATQEEAA